MFRCSIAFSYSNSSKNTWTFMKLIYVIEVTMACSSIKMECVAFIVRSQRHSKYYLYIMANRKKIV